MSSKRDWKCRHLQLDRKARRFIYLSDEHWEWLKAKGNGSATHAIREMIAFFQEEIIKNPSP
jgi:hypothetical protein